MTMRPTVLITSLLQPSLMAALEQAFKTYRLFEQSDQNVFFKEYGHEIEGIVTSGSFGAEEWLINVLPNLKIISASGVGYDRVALELTKQRGICVTNTPDVLSDAVADMAIVLLLDIIRGVSAGDRLVRQGNWKTAGQITLFGHDPKNKVCGIVGLGSIGKAIAKRAEAFSMEIAYCGRHQQQGVGYRYYDNVLDLAKASDYLILALPGGTENKHLINAEILEALGTEGYLINIARGSVVDEKALVVALQQGTIAGAGLDVFEFEPKVPNELLSLDNVVLTPHIATATIETRQAMTDLVMDNLLSFFAGTGALTPVV